MKKYDVIIIGAGPGGIYTAYELIQQNSKLSIAILEEGQSLTARKCPINGDTIKDCIHCKSCSIMEGFGGAGAFSDGKYNSTTAFGGNLHEYIGVNKTLSLMEYVDTINDNYSNYQTSLYHTNEEIASQCVKNGLHLLPAKVRHLGTDWNLHILEKIYQVLQDHKVDMYFKTKVENIVKVDDRYVIDNLYSCKYCVVSVGRSGSKWVQQICESLNIATTSNTVDIGVRVEIPYEVFKHITDKVYEGKIVYKTKKYK